MKGEKRESKRAKKLIRNFGIKMEIRILSVIALSQEEVVVKNYQNLEESMYIRTVLIR